MATVDEETSAEVNETTDKDKDKDKDKDGWIPTRQHSGIVALHRDGTEFDVELQVRMVDAEDENFYALWITFDRSVVFAKANATTGLDVIDEAAASIAAPSSASAATNEPPTSLGSCPLSSAWESNEIAASLAAYDNTSTYQQFPPRKPPSMDHASSASDYDFDLHPLTPLATTNLAPSGNSTTAGPIPVQSKSAAMASEPPRPPPHGGSQPLNVMPITPPPATTPPVALRNYAALLHNKTISDFVIVDSLGQGAYGLVKLAYKQEDPEKTKCVLKYVVKQRILVDCWTRDRHLGLVPLEIHILHTLRRAPHVNIVNMLDYFEDDEHYYIEMNLHGGGMDLFDYIEMNQNISEPEIRSIFRQVCSAVQHLHHHKIVHRDIKDENVILDEQGRVQLIDFGSAAYLREGKKYDTFCGTLDYAAPEVLSGKKYAGPPQDIYALGVLLYTLIYKENPFYNIDEIMSGALRVPFVMSEGTIDLIRRALNREVEKRPTIDDVVAHEWIVGEQDCP